jgi:hypothetical protein
VGLGLGLGIECKEFDRHRLFVGGETRALEAITVQTQYRMSWMSRSRIRLEVNSRYCSIAQVWKTRVCSQYLLFWLLKVSLGGKE